MPYQAARAIAATFCWDIRFALTPVFGADFPSTCLRPQDTGFAKFFIDPNIVKFCVQETDRFRNEGAIYRLPTLSSTSMLSPSPKLESPRMRFDQPQWRSRAAKHRRVPAMLDTESGYGSDDGNNKATITPEVSPRSVWRPVTRSQVSSPPSTNFTASMSPPITPMRPFEMSPPVTPMQQPFIRLPTPAPALAYDTSFRTKRTHSKVSLHGDDDDDMVTSRPQTSYIVGYQIFGEPMSSHTLEHYPASIPLQTGHAMSRHHGPVEPQISPSYTQKEIDAIKSLMEIQFDDKNLLSLPPTKRTRRDSTL